LPNISATKNPLSKDEFDGLGERGLIDPNRIRTTQDTIDRDFKDGRSLEQMVRELLDTPKKVIEEIRIGVTGDQVFSLDHRRLVAHRLAGKEIRYRKATDEQIRQSLRRKRGKRSKLTTTNDGTSIEILERKP